MANDTGRDPRVDPMPGDVLKGDRVKEVTGIVAAHGIVRLKLDNGRNSSVWLRGWQRWAKNATVIRKGDDNG